MNMVRVMNVHGPFLPRQNNHVCLRYSVPPWFGIALVRSDLLWIPLTAPISNSTLGDPRLILQAASASERFRKEKITF